MNRIKNLKVFLVAMMASLAFTSCDPDLDSLPAKQELEVNAHNISGKWMLETWNNAPLEDGTYVYLDIVRDDRTYTMYQNFDSFLNVPHVITGSYHIYTEPESGAVIRGNYDHDSGDWAHRYIVKSLTSDSMVWTAKDDPEFTQCFKRVDLIPVE